MLVYIVGIHYSRIGGFPVGVIETFSKRQRRLNGHAPDPFQYDVLPAKFRIQVFHIWKSSAPTEFQSKGVSFGTNLWRKIHDTACRELGIFTLGNQGTYPSQRCIEFIQKATTEDVLDLIELSFLFISNATSGFNSNMRHLYGFEQSAEEALSELNYRFREHSIGYQFEGGELIRMDSQFMHEEAVKPAIALLHEQSFKGAEEEFLNAHEHYRHGRNKEAVAEALKAFESTMKTICTLWKWTYKPTDTASKLIDLMISNELIPSYLASHFTSLRSTLESGVPVIRNKTSGHGQGDQSVELPEHFVAYVLHLTASNIVFLIESHLNRK
jgi:hypothetical protein